MLPALPNNLYLRYPLGLRKTIFISPLDWGLGHATRCVPIIHGLKTHYRVILGVTPITQVIFNEEFPELEKINVPSYNINYSARLPLSLKLLSDWPRISSVIKKEHALLDKLIAEHSIDSVISDSRFGLHSKKVHSIFITHQLFLKAPFGNFIAQNKNKKFILNFNEIWVPDYEDETKSLAGELSHGKHFHDKVSYIGPKGRLFSKDTIAIEYDYLFLLSGPQPQLSLLAKALLKKAQQYPRLKFALVAPENHSEIPPNVSSFVLPERKKLVQLIQQSKTVICRSGYSTLMDLHLLDKKEMVLIPTPGQTEQEYLAEYWKKKFNIRIICQRDVPALILDNKS